MRLNILLLKLKHIYNILPKFQPDFWAVQALFMDIRAVQALFMMISMCFNSLWSLIVLAVQYLLLT